MTSGSYSVAPKNKLVESKPNGCGQLVRLLREPSTRGDYFLMGTRGTNIRNSKAIKPEAAADSAEAAKEAGLRYVTDERPGYMRKPKGKHFEYVDAEGKPLLTTRARFAAERVEFLVENT